MGTKGRRPVPAQTRRQVMDDLDLSHSESEDELLSKQLGKSRKGADAETDDEEDMEDEEVMGLDSDDEDEEHEEDEDEEADEDEEDDEGDDDGRLASMAKYMQQKVKLQGGLDEDEDEEDEEADDKALGWSKKAKDYYGADAVDPEIESDEEVFKEEEEAAKQLQRERAEGLRAQDFELSEGEDEDEEGSEDEDQGGAAGEHVEVVQKDLDKMTDEERRAAVERDAPELQSLLAELSGALAEVRHRISPLLQEVRDGELVTQQGVSYLEAKHLLLLQYCASIVFYLLLKAEGRPVREHPVVLRLVALRGYLEKIRPIDRKLQHQMQKLLQAAKMAAQGQEGEEDGAEVKEQDFGPRPELLVPRAGAAVQEDGQAAAGGHAANGVYRPPKINPVSMEDDPDKPTMSRNDRRRIEEARRRAARSTLVQELVQELEGAPEEQKAAVAGFESVAALRQRQKLEARAEVEEDMFMRVPLSRDEVKKLKATRRMGLSGAAVLDDFADEVNDLVEMAGAPDSGRSGLADLFARHKVSQRFGADMLDEARTAARHKSGDADVPDREPLHERRAKFDSVAARRTMGGDSDEDYDNEPRGKRVREEDEFYTAAKEAARAKKRERTDAHAYPTLAPPAAERTTDQPRKITYEIEKNRGLTPHRRKDMKNPRKKHRIKFAQAVVRRKGQVQDARQDKGGYGGEATGIKSRVTKSRKF